MTRLLTAALLGLGLLCPMAPAQKKDEPGKGQLVKVKSVDDKTNTLIVMTAEGKTMTFKVDKDVHIVGPHGGKSEDRLKDDRITAGKEITLFLAPDGKTLKEIKLGYRMRTPEKDKKDKAPPEKDRKPIDKDKKDK